MNSGGFLLYSVIKIDPMLVIMDSLKNPAK